MVSALNEIGGEKLVEGEDLLDDIFDQGFFDIQKERDIQA